MRTNSQIAQKLTYTALVGGACLAALERPAHADVTLTLQQVADTAAAPQAAPAEQNERTITLSFHGGDARMDIPGGPVLIYEGKEGTIETLRPAEKTYDMTFAAELQQANDPLPPGAGSQITTNLRLDLKETDRTATIAGVTAHQYLVVGSLSYTRPQGRFGGGRGDGGRRHGSGGGGGFPGGFPLDSASALDQDDGGWNGGESGGLRRAQAPLPQFDIGGEIWLSDAVNLPDAKGATTLPAVQLAAASAGPFLKPLTDALDKKKEIPLRARITVTKTVPGGGPALDAYGGSDEGGAAGAAAPTSATTATTMAVQAISTTPVAESLLEAPADFRLVAAPVTPFDPGLPDDGTPASVSSATP